MQNQLKYLLPFILIFSFGKNLTAQDCPYSSSIKTLQGNNITTSNTIDGNLFWDKMNAGFSSNKSNQLPFPNTIFNSGLWMGAFDSAGDLRISVAKYNSGSSYDYVAGPISNNNGQIIFDCENFNRQWEVFGYEIYEHISDFEDNGIIDHPIQNIFAYPGHQNPFFENIHGFSLPNTIHRLAPFFDNDNDGNYDPSQGDYPLPEAVHNNTIPAQIIWGIFNDAGATHINNATPNPLNVEIHQTSWSFNCADNDLLNNSIFVSQKIINKDLSPLDSMFVSHWTDLNIGCYFDDYIGCMPDMNTFYSYNRDSVDGTSGDTCWTYDIPTFGDNPPVHSVTILNQEMTNFNYYHDQGDYPPYNPWSPIGYYSYMNGFVNSFNGNIVPLTYGGWGFGATTQPETSFAFPSHPNDVTGWSMAQSGLPSFNFLSNANIYINSLQPNESRTIDIVHTFFQDENLDNIESVDLVYDNTPLIQALYDNNFQDFCNNPSFCNDDCVWTGDANQDSIVTNCDILQIGLGYNEQGTTRNQPLAWHPYESENWNTSLLGVDLKHADCNGNSIIDSIDFEFVDYYFGNSYKTDPPIDIYSYGSEISIDPSVNLDTLSPGDPGLIKIKLNQEEDLFGIAFTVEYNPVLLAIENNTSSLLWLNTAMEDTYLFQKSQSQKGEYHYAIVKTDGENSTTDNGTFLNLGVEVLDTDYELIQTVIRIKNIKAILKDGTILDYGANNYLINISNPDGNGIILENENLENNNMQIFPNPTSDILNIKMENPTADNFTIFDIYGKKVLEKTEVNQSESQLSTSTFSPGIYFLKIEMEGKEFIKKFIKL